MLENFDTRKKIEIGIFLIILVTAIIYSVFRLYPLIQGPTIEIYSPNNWSNVASTTFEISGRSLREKEITLQGKPITVDTEGYFKERLVGSLPYTIIVLVATDRYGRSETKTLNVIPNL